MTGVLVTNGAPHPSEEWAMATAQMIFPANIVQDNTRRIEAMRLQADIAQAIVPHHARVHEDEGAALKSEGDARFDAAHEVGRYIEEAIATIQQKAANTPWAEHFNRADVLVEVRQIVGSHMATIQHIQRLWHGDPSPAGDAYRARNGISPPTESARAYHAKFHAPDIQQTPQVQVIHDAAPRPNA